MRTMGPKMIGEMSESLVLAHLLKLGFSVSVPFGNSQKYDLVLDRAGKLDRVQVKTGRIKNGCVVFQTAARNTINGKRTSYYGAADLLMIYCPDNGLVYVVPITADMNASTMALRLDRPSNGQASGIRWAADHIFPKPDA